jgi:hypothetical protein
MTQQVEAVTLTDAQIEALAVRYCNSGGKILAAGLGLTDALEEAGIADPGAVLIAEYRALVTPYFHQTGERIAGQSRPVLGLLGEHFFNRRNFAIAAGRALAKQLGRCGMTGEAREMIERHAAAVEAIIAEDDLETGPRVVVVDEAGGIEFRHVLVSPSQVGRPPDDRRRVVGEARRIVQPVESRLRKVEVRLFAVFHRKHGLNLAPQFSVSGYAHTPFNWRGWAAR